MSVAEFTPPAQSLHVVVLSARHTRAALLAIEDSLGSSPAELCGLSLKPVGAIVEAVLRLRGLDDRTADRLAQRLSAGLGVHSVKVEHQWELK
jgi:hypothetical protein